MPISLLHTGSQSAFSHLSTQRRLSSSSSHHLISFTQPRHMQLHTVTHGAPFTPTSLIVSSTQHFHIFRTSSLLFQHQLFSPSSAASVSTSQSHTSSLWHTALSSHRHTTHIRSSHTLHPSQALSSVTLVGHSRTTFTQSCRHSITTLSHRHAFSHRICHNVPQQSAFNTPPRTSFYVLAQVPRLHRATPANGPTTIRQFKDRGDTQHGRSDESPRRPTDSIRLGRQTTPARQATQTQLHLRPTRTPQGRVFRTHKRARPKAPTEQRSYPPAQRRPRTNCGIRAHYDNRRGDATPRSAPRASQ